MRILFDQSAHDMRNKGNNALLQAAINRLSRFWPHASFDLITVAPHLARLYFPETRPVKPDDLRHPQSRLDKMQQVVPRSLWWLLFELREDMWHRRAARQTKQRSLSKFSNHSSSAKAGKPDITVNSQRPGPHSEGISDKTALQEAISGYDLVVASGGGYMCDHDKWQLLNVFDRLEAATTQGIPTVMVGQGVGPMQDQDLRTRAGNLLPQVDLICYRNRRLGLPLLEALGVPPERMMMTGDDAIELAYQARPASPGTGIGVSLRVSSYTQVGQQHINLVRSILHQAATERQARLIAAPISSAPHESDISYIRQLLAGYNQAVIGWQKLESPLAIIKKIGQCRLTITGTYHGAIFSLAQGIPVVGLAKSGEYFNKLSELTDEFGPGCQTIALEDEQFPNRLATAIHTAWESADKVRPALLKVAAQHIEWQRAAYHRIYNLV